jgi:hypothetical protein
METYNDPEKGDCFFIVIVAIILTCMVYCNNCNDFRLAESPLLTDYLKAGLQETCGQIASFPHLFPLSPPTFF